MTPSVVGLDLSLRATGYASSRGERILRSSLRGGARLEHLRDQLRGHLADDAPALVVMEDYAFSRGQAHAHELGEWGGVARLTLFEADLHWMTVKPTTLKVYATGRGNADKDAVLVSAVRRLGYSGESNDEADALWLRAFGMALLGWPLVDLPKEHTRALDSAEAPSGAMERSPK